MKKINISITGALGRMGKILVKKVLINKIFNLYSITDKKIGEKFGKNIVQNNNINAFKKTDVIIDFSTPNASIEVLNYAKKLKKNIII